MFSLHVFKKCPFCLTGWSFYASLHCALGLPPSGSQAPWTSCCFSVPAHDFVSPQPLSAQTERWRVHDSPAAPAGGRGPNVPVSSCGLEQFIVVCGPPGPQGSEGTVGHWGDPGWICWLLMPEFPQGTRKAWILPKASERSKPCSPARVRAPLHTPRKDMPSQPACPAQPVAPRSKRAAERAGRRPHCIFAPLDHSPFPIPPAVQATPPTLRAEGNEHFPGLADPVLRNLDRTQWGSLSLRQDIQSPRRRQAAGGFLPRPGPGLGWRELQAQQGLSLGGGEDTGRCRQLGLPPDTMATGCRAVTQWLQAAGTRGPVNKVEAGQPLLTQPQKAHRALLLGAGVSQKRRGHSMREELKKSRP